MLDATHTIDLNDYKTAKKPFKFAYDVKEAVECLKFLNDINGQVVFGESGKNVVVTAYATQEVTYQKVETTISSVKIKKGKYRGKFECVTKIYKATYDDGGNVTGYEDGAVVKTTYVSKKGDDTTVTTYQTVNSANKVIVTSAEENTGDNQVIVNKGKVLGTVTYTNGDKCDDLRLVNADGTFDLINTPYAPVKKKNSYTGTWLQEQVASTSANETFSLGVNRSDLDPDVITYDLASKHGKDTVTLSKGSLVDIDLENDGGVIKTFAKSKKNTDVTMSLGKTSDYDENPDYTKQIMTVTKKSGDEYKVTTIEYSWEDDEYVEISKDSEIWPYESVVLVGKYMKQTYGVDLHVGTNIYYLDDSRFMYQGGESALARITFKNYLKNAEDSVMIGDESLKTLLENAKGVGILGNRELNKNQTLAGTFLNEQFYGGKKNDTITTGTGDDMVYLSKGTDTISVNGSGSKSIYFYNDESEEWLALGATTVKFAKGTSFAIPTEEEPLADGKTSLNIAGVAGKEDFSYGFVKSGNDLTLDSDAVAKFYNQLGENIPYTKQTLTIKDFFAENGAINGTIFGYSQEDGHPPVTFDDMHLPVFQFGNAKKANKMSDTKYQDMIVGGAQADKFTVTHGDAQIVGGKGNDTISIKEGAEGTVNVLQTVGAGNDTLSIDAGVGDDVEVLVDGAYSVKMNDGKADIAFTKKGNNLIFSTTYFKDTIAGIKKNTTDTLTVNDFFTNDIDVTFGYNGEEPAKLQRVLTATDKYLNITGVKSGKTVKYDGTKYTDSMTYTGSGKATMAGGANDDSYTVKLTKTSNVVVTDTEGENVLNLLNKASDIRIFFNADTNGDIIINNPKREGGIVTDFLWIYDKNAVTLKNIGGANTGKIAVEHCFEDDGATSAAHYSGVTTTDGNFDIAKYVPQIASEVANWFSQGTRAELYSDAMDVFDPSKQNIADKTSLLAVYNKEYDPNFNPM